MEDATQRRRVGVSTGLLFGPCYGFAKNALVAAKQNGATRVA
jgi:hypothetical protein